MSHSSDNHEGEELSLDRLSEAYAQATGGRRPRRRRKPASDAANEHAEQAAIAPVDVAEDGEQDDAPVSPESILEAMLFVGQPDNSALSSEQASAVMRDVEPGEIDELVVRLNAKYAEQQNAFEIVRGDDGYRLRLREEFSRLRDVFLGRTREVTLSQAAVDVLALVAYKQPITLEEISKFRGFNSGGIVRQLVRRKLIRFDIDAEDQRVKQYYTTRRMLNLLGLENLEDLPQSDDA